MRLLGAGERRSSSWSGGRARWEQAPGSRGQVRSDSRREEHENPDPPLEDVIVDEELRPRLAAHAAKPKLERECEDEPGQTDRDRVTATARVDPWHRDVGDDQDGRREHQGAHDVARRRAEPWNERSLAECAVGHCDEQECEPDGQSAEGYGTAPNLRAASTERNDGPLGAAGGRARSAARSRG